HRGVEALVRERELAVVGLDELRPALAAGAPPRLAQQRPGAVHAGDAEAGAGKRDRVAAEPARGVEQLAGPLAPAQLRGRQGLRLGLEVTLLGREGAQVEVAEEGVPDVGRARAALGHACAGYPA